MEKNDANVLYAIEVHAAEDLNRYFEDGGNPNGLHDNVPLFTTMVEMYLRSPRFKDCVKVFMDHGLEFADKALLAVLCDDAEMLLEEIREDDAIVSKRYSAFRNTFTSLDGATLLHYCAEYNHLECAKVLIANGADANAKAGYDANGFGGHTPIFHTVSQHNNNSVEMLHFLLEHAADARYMIKGLIWGKGYEWETFIPAVNPMSYAMMGLLPQMHRNPQQIAANVSILMRQAFGIKYTLPNVPNLYLANS